MTSKGLSLCLCLKVPSHSLMAPFCQIIKHSMWVLLEIILFGALLLYSTVSFDSSFLPQHNKQTAPISPFGFISTHHFFFLLASSASISVFRADFEYMHCHTMVPRARLHNRLRNTQSQTLQVKRERFIEKFKSKCHQSIPIMSLSLSLSLSLWLSTGSSLSFSHAKLMSFSSKTKTYYEYSHSSSSAFSAT